MKKGKVEFLKKSEMFIHLCKDSRENFPCLRQMAKVILVLGWCEVEETNRCHILISFNNFLLSLGTCSSTVLATMQMPAGVLSHVTCMIC